MPSISNDGGKGPRIPGAHTPESLSAFEAGYEGINWNAREELPDVPEDPGSPRETT